MENSGNKKSAQQLALRNASKLNANQIYQYIYFKPRRTLWQRVKEAINHE